MIVSEILLKNYRNYILRGEDVEYKKYQEMIDIKKRLDAGEDFATLAMELSEDKGSAQKGGDLGWFGIGRMVREFEKATFALNPGETSEIIKTQFGYHIINVIDKKGIEPFEKKKGDINEKEFLECCWRCAWRSTTCTASATSGWRTRSTACATSSKTTPRRASRRRRRATENWRIQRSTRWQLRWSASLHRENNYTFR